jgi:hypothetical protein
MAGRAPIHVSRRRRFTRQEIESLLAEVRRHRDVLLLSAPKYGSLDEARSRAWFDISLAVSGVSGILRRPQELRKKWSDLKVLAQRLRDVNPSALEEDEVPKMVFEIISGVSHISDSGEWSHQSGVIMCLVCFVTRMIVTSCACVRQF